MRILFVPFGSEGDVNPLVWMAHGLSARGHEPVFLLSPHYRSRVEGLEWHPIGTEEDFERLARNPHLWHARWGTFMVARAMHESLPVYRQAFWEAGEKFDLVVTSSFAFGAACVADARRIPRLMVHLQPICFRSADEIPLFGKNLRWTQKLPPAMKRMLFVMMDTVCNLAILPPVNRFRRRLRVPAWRNFYNDALMGGDAIAGLFPAWFAAPHPDWPAKARLFGFPTVRPPSGDLPESLSRWVGEGKPPVLWTHGSANLHTRDFFAAAVRASRETGTRALLVGRSAPDLPQGADVHHITHVPFEDVFPHCAAVVHHGGIGTTAKAFANGLPQVIVPLAHDQFDNAERIERLGGGRSGTLASVSHDLSLVLGSQRIRETARGFVSKMQDDPTPALCDFAEAVAARV